MGPSCHWEGVLLPACLLVRGPPPSGTDAPVPCCGMQTTSGTMMNTQKLRLYAGAALPYGKPTYFEAAVEAFPDNITVCAHVWLCMPVSGA